MNISHLVKMCAMNASSSELAISPLPYLSYSNRLPGKLDDKINDAKLKLILAIASLTKHNTRHHMMTSSIGNISALLAICARNSPVDLFGICLLWYCYA